jgi:hypothetical protein
MLLKNNHIPKGLIPSEKIFDENDVVVKPSIHPQIEEVEDCNIGTDQEPKFIKISKKLFVDQKKRYVDLFKEYIDFLHGNMKT